MGHDPHVSYNGPLPPKEWDVICGWSLMSGWRQPLALLAVDWPKTGPLARCWPGYTPRLPGCGGSRPGLSRAQPLRAALRLGRSLGRGLGGGAAGSSVSVFPARGAGRPRRRCVAASLAPRQASPNVHSLDVLHLRSVPVEVLRACEAVSRLLFQWVVAIV